MSDWHVMRYAAYKESGVEWIGGVPAHWEVKRLKEFSGIVNGATPKSSIPENWDGELHWVTTDDLGKLSSKYITETKRKISEHGYVSCGTTICKKGSVVISGRAPIGHIGILAIDACTNQGCKTLMMNHQRASNLFIYYCLIASKPKLEALGRGTTFIELSTKELSLFLLAFPPLPEQTAIAAYLDTKTAQIDRQAELLSKKAMQYGKLKQSLINETVTHGMDSSVPMKESGVEWIGEVPAHWEVKRAKDLFKKHDRKCFDHDDIVTAFRDGQVTRRLNRRTSGFTNAIKEIGYQRIHSGDLVIHAMDAFAGAIGVSDSTGKSSPVYSAYTTLDKRKTFMPYYGKLLREMAVSGFISSLGKGIRERSTEFRHREFAPLELVLPPFEEQTAIAAYLDTKTAQIDRIVSTINTQIDKLKELRKTLINDVVTGKIKVITEGELA